MTFPEYQSAADVSFHYRRLVYGSRFGDIRQAPEFVQKMFRAIHISLWLASCGEVAS